MINKSILFFSLLILVGSGCSDIDRAKNKLEALQEQAMQEMQEESLVDQLPFDEEQHDETPTTEITPPTPVPTPQEAVPPQQRETPPAAIPMPAPVQEQTPPPTPVIYPPVVVPAPVPSVPVCTDGDEDGFFAEGGSCGPQDCEDLYASVNPNGFEVCADGLDNNCNGAIDEDGCKNRRICLGEGCASTIIYED